VRLGPSCPHRYHSEGDQPARRIMVVVIRSAQE